MSTNGILDFQGTNKATFVGENSNVVIDTVNASFGIGVDVNGPTSNLHVVGNAYVTSNLEVGTANLFVDTVSGRVGIGKTDPGATLDVVGDVDISSNLDVHGTAHLSNVASTDYSKQFSQTYDLDFDGITATDEELSLFQFEPGIYDFITIQGEVDVDILSKRAQTYIQFGPQKVKIKFSFSWDARGVTGSWLKRDISIDRTKLSTNGTQFLNYPVEVRYKYKGDRSTDPEIPPKVQVYLRYNGTNFVAKINVKGMYHSNYTDYGLSFPSSIFTTDGDTTDASVDTVTTYDINTGNVGLGTDDPGKKLHINGDLRIGSSPNDTVDDNNSREISTAGQLIIKSNDSGLNDSFVNLVLQSGNTNPGKIVISGGTTDQYRDIEFYTSGSSTERMRIHHNGNVGIGTNDPLGRLDVRGAIIAPVVSYLSNQDAPYLIAGTPGYTGAATNWDTHGFQHRIKTNDGGTPRITVDAPSGGEVFSIVNGGNIGIGTTNPTAQLHISSGNSGDCVLKIEADEDNNDELDNPRIEFITDGGYNTALVGAGQMPFETTNDNALVLAALQMKFYTGSVQDFTDSTTMTERMRILSNGNVGIGTTSPATKLNIQGDSGGVPPTTGGEGTSNGIFRVRDNYNVALDIGTKGSSPWTTWLQVADATSMGTEYPLSLQPNGGNVGIGKTDPDAMLHVNGNAIIGDRRGYATNGYTDAQLTLGGTHNTNLYNQDDQVKLLITGGNNDGGSPYYIMCEDENGNDQFYVKGGNTSSGSNGVTYVRGVVGIKQTSPSYTLDVNGTIRYTSSGSSASDDRIKYNEEDISSPLALISQLKPQKYEKIMEFPNPSEGTWIPTDEEWETAKDEYKYGDEFGFIAQDIHNIPELKFLVSGEETKMEMKTVSLEEYSNLTTEERSTYTTPVYMYISTEDTISMEQYSNLTSEVQQTYTQSISGYTKEIETQTPLSLNYQGLFVVAIGAIKELKTQLATVLARLDALENA